MATSLNTSVAGRERALVPIDAERKVADLLPIEVDPALARATVERVPFWFHTFALNRAEGIYTPGAARDHRYRISTPSRRLRRDERARRRHLRRLLRLPRRAPGGRAGSWRWTTSSTGSGSPPGGTSSWRAARASAPSIACSARPSSIARMDAFELDQLDERFDLVYCFGILHRVENPLGLLTCAARADGERRQRAARDLRRPPGRSRTGPRSASRSPVRSTRATSSSTGGSGTASSGLPGSQASLAPSRRRRGGRRPPADHRSARVSSFTQRSHAVCVSAHEAAGSVVP